MKKINIKSHSISLLILFSLFVLPHFVRAQIVYVCASSVAGECTFDDLIRAVQKLTNWGSLFAIQFSVVVLAWAGFKYMISGDNAGERKEANKLIMNVLKGIALIICAWLIVNLIIKGLGVNVNTFLG